MGGREVTAALLTLLAAAVTYAVSYSLGAMLLGALRVRLYRSEVRFFSFVLGSACLSTLIFALNAAGMARRGVFYTLALVVLGLAAWRRVYRPAGEPFPPLPRLWSVVFWAVFSTFTFLYVTKAMAPETSSDGVAYHLGLVTRYLREHRFAAITTDLRASFPQGLEMLFEFAFTIGRHSGAAMVEFLFLLVLPFGILSYARRIGKPIAGVAGALLVYLSPVVGRTGTIAYVDVAAATVAFAVFCALQLWMEERTAAFAAIVGILSGFAFAIKYTGVAAVVYAVGFLCVAAFRSGKRDWRAPAIASASAAFVMMPWLIKNAIVVGNPVSPFLNRVFPNPYVYPWFEAYLNVTYREMGGVKLTEIPLELTVYGLRLSGLLGPLFLLAPFALLALRNRHGRQVLLAATVFAVPYFSNIGARFAIPALPFVALAMAMAVESLPAVVLAALALHAVLSWPAVIPMYAQRDAWCLGPPAWREALRLVPEETVLRDVVPGYEMGRLLDRLVPDGGRVFNLALENTAYHSRELVSHWASAFGLRMRETLLTATRPHSLPGCRAVMSFPQIEARRVRVVQSRDHRDPMQVFELRVYRNGSELARDPRWRLRASANPWEVQAAFDASLATFWTSLDPAKAGDYLQIDFAHPVQLDRIEMDLPEALTESGVEFHVEMETPGGVWRAVPAESKMVAIPLPPQPRRAAIEELKSHRIGWLLCHDGDEISQDFSARWGQWGIKEVAASGGYRLWRFE